MRNSHKFQMVLFTIIITMLSCSKEETQIQEELEAEFLQFSISSKVNGNEAVLYSDWIPSGFPNSSSNNSEIWDFPLVENSLFNPDKDLLLVYGKKGNVFTLPVTMPIDDESYIVELLPGKIGTTTRLRATSLSLGPLQDIFFRPSSKARFRIVIVPGEKLLTLKTGVFPEIQKMSYAEVSTRFNIPD